VNRDKFFYSVLESFEGIIVEISSNKIDSEEFKKIFSELEKKFGNLDGELIFDSYFSTLRINIKNKGINKNDILNFIYKLK
jgi:hypothetical protein